MSQAPYDPVSGRPPPWPPASPAPKRSGSWVLGVIGSVLGLLGLVAGASAWLRPLPPADPSAPVYSEQEVADAKRAVCEAYGKFNQALTATSSRDGGDDPTARLAVAVNIRLALYAGGDYLLNALDAHPATAAALSRPIRGMAATYQEAAIRQLGEVPRGQLDKFAESAKSYGGEIDEVCR